jgi:hypothetical protein
MVNNPDHWGIQNNIFLSTGGGGKKNPTDRNAQITMGHFYVDNHQMKITHFTYQLQLAVTFRTLLITPTL